MASSAHPVLATLPTASLFGFPPNSRPVFLPPPPPASIPNSPPFAVPDHIYQAALDVRVPVTIASVYAITVAALNRYNRSTSRRPWAVSRTRLFFAFVVLHNVVLAAYSAWTWWGMLGALRRSFVSPFGPDGLAGTVDSVCKLNGAAGLGKAAFFSEDDQRWQSYGTPLTRTSAGALSFPAHPPSRTETGRIWNEGLAFYGWLFYLSKFYEVLDTFIILAKGKLSSTLQTYHHAGAMMCMWAGMRYMSAPIWMFVFVNSGIHAMMVCPPLLEASGEKNCRLTRGQYTYYTLSAFSIRVPTVVKRTLTSMQITQFLVGASYAMAHSFVSYSFPFDVTEKVVTGAAAAAAAAESHTGAALLDNVKNFVLGAVFGTASAVASPAPESTAAGTETVRSVRDWTTVPCITTTGATFAIWLNVLYLAPLTYLFVKFFITSYLRRSNAEKTAAKVDAERSRRTSNVVLAEKAGWDAAKDLEKEVYGENGSPTANGTRATNGRPARANGRANGAAKR